jgi:hypothetical protein
MSINNTCCVVSGHNDILMNQRLSIWRVHQLGRQPNANAQGTLYASWSGTAAGESVHESKIFHAIS